MIPGMNFSEALDFLKQGSKIQRVGWNGKGMWLVLQKAYPEGIEINKNTAEATGISEGHICNFLPYIMMKVADVVDPKGDTPKMATTFVPWLASQTDVLAEDWRVVE